MRVLVDVDGVCADCVTPVLNAINEEFGKHYKTTDITSFYFIDPQENILTPEECTYAKACFSAEGFASSLGIVPNSREYIDKLRELNHEVVFVTSPWRYSKTWSYERREWLIEHFDASVDDVVLAHNKTLVSGDLLIDDKIQNCQEYYLAHPFSQVYMYTQPWNSQFDMKLLGRMDRFTWNKLHFMGKPIELNI